MHLLMMDMHECEEMPVVPILFIVAARIGAVQRVGKR